MISICKQYDAASIQARACVPQIHHYGSTEDHLTDWLVVVGDVMNVQYFEIAQSLQVIICSRHVCAQSQISDTFWYASYPGI